MYIFIKRSTGRVKETSDQIIYDKIMKRKHRLVKQGENALKKNSWETLIAPATPNMYERFITGIKTGRNDQPDFAAGARVQDYLDASFISDKKKKWIKV